jgi:hypothetical protein
MGVLNKVIDGGVDVVRKVRNSVARDPEPTLDREAQLEVEVGAALAAKTAAVTDVEVAYLEEAEGGPDRIANAEATLQAAEVRLTRAQRTLEAHRSIAAKRASEAARSSRAASWKHAERLAQDRVVAAGRLAASLRVAGENYAELVRLGLAAYNEMPAAGRGGPSTYRLSPGDVAAVVGIDLLRAGLPDGAKISTSMLSQYPGIAEIVASSLDMIRLARRDDEART